MCPRLRLETTIGALQLFAVQYCIPAVVRDSWVNFSGMCFSRCFPSNALYAGKNIKLCRATESPFSTISSGGSSLMINICAASGKRFLSRTMLIFVIMETVFSSLRTFQFVEVSNRIDIIHFKMVEMYGKKNGHL